MASQPTDRAALDHLRSLPFVRKLRFRTADGGRRLGPEDDGILEIATPHGLYSLSLQVKKSLLDRSLVNAIIGPASSRPAARKRGQSGKCSGKLLLARYVPAALGEQFVESGICFADEPGNLHLRLGAEYNWTVLGKREPPKLPEAERATPAAIQLLFQLAAEPASAAWTVRDLARAAGIGKSKVALLRQQFLRERVLSRKAGRFEFRMTPETADRLVAGYARTLRPKLLIGRYRYPDASVEEFVARLAKSAPAHKLAYALTGGPAADLMQHFYSGPEAPVFLAEAGPGAQRHLRLIPDRNGPALLLKPFGQLVYWRQVEGKMVAPPWLIYAELLTSADPRAREAAEEFRRGFLQ